ncbi:MAG: hypothetical protein ABI598_07165 [Chloroflexota bacterium]
MAIRPSDILEVSSERITCLRNATLAFAPSRTLPQPRLSGAFDYGMTTLPSDRQFGAPSAGDWVIRLIAEFDGAEPSRPAGVIVVAYFRVLSGDGPFPSLAAEASAAPTPLVTPAVPCGTTVPGPNTPVAAGLAGQQGVNGAVGRPKDPPIVEAPLGEPVFIVVGGNPCATSWRIVLGDPLTGIVRVVDSIENPTDDPNVAAQNRWQVVPFGERILIATLHFPGSDDVVRSWRLRTRDFAIPQATLIGPDGARFGAQGGCGLTVTLSSGYQTSEGCDGIGYEPGLAFLRVAANQPVHFDLAGWQIVSWSAEAAATSHTGGLSFEASLGGAASSDGRPLPDPAVFVLPTGDWIVHISTTATNEARTSFSVSYFARVVAQ